ncbi:hypothetical protein [Streptomyces fagopyri]|uniref:hypothetical protein n=1 Tax=Streptomyces fagopyri TaxID=2662397 RepID=UPI0033CED226
MQESLTNAVKYTAGHQTLVRLSHTADWTEVEVTTPEAVDATPESAAPHDGGLHIREAGA